MLHDLHIFSNVGSKRRQEWDYLKVVRGTGLESRYI